MWAAILFAAGLGAAAAAMDAAPKRPNVVLIMTDDQGYGDLGWAGNPIVQTPNIDRLATHSAILKSFYVSPVCTPTRASLMTGRYNYRTRAIDTFRGRAMMEPSETTVAEILRGAGYATGIFGKWHLGDSYPMRAMDQGFQESLVHRGGGIGQPSDPPGGEGKYTDPILLRNGRPVSEKGYCTDVYFREGMRWAGDQVRKGKPFFLYLPTNAPHGPFDDVPRHWYERYRKESIRPDRFPSTPGHAVPPQLNADVLARVYAMISNVDENVGRLVDWLDREKVAERTLVIFMTDNGEATAGYNAGLRGRKSEVYEGGIRSPFFACWPGVLQPGAASDRIAAHIDLLPTLLEACEVRMPKDLRLDGRSLLPLLRRSPRNWPDRTLIFQAHRGDAPVRHHNFAARTQQWKLVHNSGFGRETLPPGPLKLELFDMEADPYETRNAAAEHPEVVADLRRRYDTWFDDVGSTRPDNYAPPRIRIGSRNEDPVVLTRQDWRGAGWGPRDRGHWEVEVDRGGTYQVTLRFAAPARPATAGFSLGDARASVEVPAGARLVTLERVRLPQGPGRLEAFLTEGDETRGVMFVELSRR